MSTPRWNGTTKTKASVLIFWILLLIIAGIIRLWDLEFAPPPLWRDEAKNGLDMLPVLQGLQYPIYFERLGGREPIFYYLQAACIAVFGLTTFALRFPAAIVGLITIPVFYVLARILFPQKSQIAYVTTGAVTFSFWHLFWSRLGERGILVPLFVAATLYTFWRGWRFRSRLWLTISGVVLGVSLYTYTPNRALPLVIVAFVLSEILISRANCFKERLASWYCYSIDAIYFVLPALLTSLPLVLYLRSHPMAGYRMGIVSAFSDGWTSPQTWSNLVTNTWRAIGMFLWQGDLEPGRNLPGRPVWDYLLGAFFVVGCIVALRYWRRAENRLILLSLGIMLLPTILSIDTPNEIRALGALPAACLLVSVGLDWVYEQVTKRIHPLPGYAYSVVIACVLAISGAWTLYDYFVRWAPQETTYHAFESQTVEIVNYVREQPQDTDVYLPLRLYNSYPQIIFWTLQDFPARRSFLSLTSSEQNDLQRRNAVVLLGDDDRTDLSAFVCLTRSLPGDKGSTVFLPHFSNFTHRELRKTLEQMDSEPDEIRGRYGRTLALAYRVAPEARPWQVPSTPSHAMQVNLADEIELTGYDLASHRFKPGERFWLAVYWRRIGQPRDNYLGFAQAVDQELRAWGGGGDEGDRLSVLPWSFPVLFWRESEIVPDFFEVRLSKDMPPGKYHLCVGLYQSSTGERLTVVPPQGSPYDGMIKLTTLSVGIEDADVRAIQHPLTASLGDSIRLLGYDLENPQLAPGADLHVTLYWEARDATPTDYTVFTHLLDLSGQLVTGYDSQPQGARNPTSTWVTGETIKDRITLSIPSETPSGSYELEIGMYDLHTGARLPVEVSEQEGLASDHLRIPGLQIAAGDRPPSP